MVTDVKTFLNARRPAARLVAAGTARRAGERRWSGTAQRRERARAPVGRRLGPARSRRRSQPAKPPAAPAPASSPAPAPSAPARAPGARPAARHAQPAPTRPAQPAPAAQAGPAVPVVLPKVQAVSETLTVTGNAEAVNAVKLVARVPGYLEQIHFQDGQIVKKDDLAVHRPAGPVQGPVAAGRGAARRGDGGARPRPSRGRPLHRAPQAARRRPGRGRPLGLPGEDRGGQHPRGRRRRSRSPGSTSATPR